MTLRLYYEEIAKYNRLITNLNGENEESERLFKIYEQRLMEIIPTFKFWFILFCERVLPKYTDVNMKCRIYNIYFKIFSVEYESDYYTMSSLIVMYLYDEDIVLNFNKNDLTTHYTMKFESEGDLLR